MPSLSPVTGTATLSRWWNNWGHFVIMLPLIILGSWAIHWPAFSIILILIEMDAFEGHVRIKHPDHPIIYIPEYRYRYSVAQLIGWPVGFLGSVFIPDLQGLLPIAACLPLVLDIMCISTLIHVVDHSGDHHTQRDGDIIQIAVCALMATGITSLIARFIATM